MEVGRSSELGAALEAAKHHEQRQDAPAALELYRRALEIDPSAIEAVEGLGRMMRWAGLVSDFRLTCRRHLALFRDEPQRLRLQLFLADLLAQPGPGADPNAALDEIKTALLLKPTAAEAAARLERLATQTGRLPEIASWLGELIVKQTTAESRASLYLALARVYVAFGTPDYALTCLKSALSDDPTSPITVARVREGFEALGRVDLFVASAEEVLAARPHGPENVGLLRELARLYSTVLAAPDRAMEHLATAVSFYPAEPELSDELLRLAAATKQMPYATQLFEDAVRRIPDPAARTGVRTRLARVYRETLHAPEEAVRLWAAVLDDDATNEEARRLLVAIEEPEREAAAESEEDMIAAFEATILPGSASSGAEAAAAAPPLAAAPGAAAVAASDEIDAESVAETRIPNKPRGPTPAEPFKAATPGGTPIEPFKAAITGSTPVARIPITRSAVSISGETPVPAPGPSTSGSTPAPSEVEEIRAELEPIAPAPAAPRKSGRARVPVGPIAVFSMIALGGSAAVATDVLWPTVKLKSEPPGATVVLDGVALSTKTPADLKVAPGVEHEIELLLAGKAPRSLGADIRLARLESTEFLVRFDVPTRTISIGPSEATLTLNGKVIGTGTKIEIHDLDPTAPASIHIEAKNMKPWVRLYERGSEVPEVLFVTLRPFMGAQP